MNLYTGSQVASHLVPPGAGFRSVQNAISSGKSKMCPRSTSSVIVLKCRSGVCEDHATIALQCPAPANRHFAVPLGRHS